MLTAIVTRIVAACCRHAKLVILLAAIITAASAYFAVTRFAINTDSSKLISDKLPWRERQAAFTAAFPDSDGLILVVIDGDTPEVAQAAASSLVDRLKDEHDHFDFVRLPVEQAFFAQYGLLFQSTDKVKATVDQLDQSQPLLAQVASDPSLRGFMTTLSLLSIGVERGQTPLDKVANLAGKVADTTSAAIDGRFVPFSMQQLLAGQGDSNAAAISTRRFVQIKPKLNYGNLEPGQAATDAVEKAVGDLHLDAAHGVKVRLTGQIPLDDQEFSTVKDGFTLNSIITVMAVLVILWLALKSARLIVAVFISTFVGLLITAAVGLAIVGALNLISIAFAVLFIGIGVDFGIQFSVRYRDERYTEPKLVPAIVKSGVKAGRALSLAAAATAAGFYSFLPTDYRGVSELGLIAGNGMIIAFFVSITLLPALLTLLHPPSEGREVGYTFLAPLDDFLSRHRWWVIGLTVGTALVGSPLLAQVKFDFNPLNLNSPKVESVATLLDLMQDPATTPNKIDVLSPSLDQAKATAGKLNKLPEVGSTRTLANLIPPDQAAKLPLIQDAADTLGPALNPPQQKPAPSDEDNVIALKAAAVRFDKAALKGSGAAADAAHRLSDSLRKLAAAPVAARDLASQAIVPALKVTVSQLRDALGAHELTLATLPADIKRDWTTPGGEARIEVTPKNLSNSNDNLESFANAVLTVAPDATGQPVTIQDSGRSVIGAFIEAGALALISISILLFIVLRKVVDVALTLVPLLLAGVLTMEITVLIGLPLNFANIIALPLLLGLGVAFKIYFVMAWRAGQTKLLQSSLTRAVFFSAMATAVAFGSLWSSKHPGTSSMGELLALSLACTLVAAVFFQPALMGPPRQTMADPKPEALGAAGRRVEEAAE